MSCSSRLVLLFELDLLPVVLFELGFLPLGLPDPAELSILTRLPINPGPGRGPLSFPGDPGDPFEPLELPDGGPGPGA